MSFFRELKRRNVFRVGIAYLAGAWLLVQVADILLDTIGAPPWVMLTLFVVLAVGFFISLFIAWAYEMTPEGIKRDKDIDSEQRQVAAQRNHRPLDYVIFALILAGIGWLVFRDNLKLDDAFSPGATPVVILMDTYAPRGVYDQETRERSGTNADVLSDILRDLPIETHKEAIGSSWDREHQVLMQQPDLIVIHRSGFFHSMNLEFGFGYADQPESYDEQRADRLYEVADNRLQTFLGLVATGSPDTRFLIYSRGTGAGWSLEDYRNEWVSGLEQRFPDLKGRVYTFAMPGGVEKGSFFDPETVSLVRQQVSLLLGLEVEP